MAILYAVHPSGSVTALQLATAYGLVPGEYITVTDPSSVKEHEYIHLRVRDDGAYRSIKYELGDERDGVIRYIGGPMWREVKVGREKRRRSAEDSY